MFRYALSRLKESSTWAGLIGLTSIAGIILSPDLTNSIIVVGTALSSAVLTLLPDGAGK